jgi:hypothetical protein
MCFAHRVCVEGLFRALYTRRPNEATRTLSLTSHLRIVHSSCSLRACVSSFARSPPFPFPYLALYSLALSRRISLPQRIVDSVNEQGQTRVTRSRHPATPFRAMPHHSGTDALLQNPRVFFDRSNSQPIRPLWLAVSSAASLRVVDLPAAEVRRQPQTTAAPVVIADAVPAAAESHAAALASAAAPTSVSEPATGEATASVVQPVAGVVPASVSSSSTTSAVPASEADAMLEEEDVDDADIDAAVSSSAAAAASSAPDASGESAASSSASGATSAESFDAPHPGRLGPDHPLLRFVIGPMKMRLQELADDVETAAVAPGGVPRSASSGGGGLPSSSSRPPQSPLLELFEIGVPVSAKTAGSTAASAAHAGGAMAQQQ